MLAIVLALVVLPSPYGLIAVGVAALHRGRRGLRLEALALALQRQDGHRGAGRHRGDRDSGVQPGRTGARAGAARSGTRAAKRRSPPAPRRGWRPSTGWFSASSPRFRPGPEPERKRAPARRPWFRKGRTANRPSAGSSVLQALGSPIGERLYQLNTFQWRKFQFPEPAVCETFAALRALPLEASPPTSQRHPGGSSVRG